MASTKLRKIAFFMPHLFQGGAEKIMVILANELGARDIQVDFVLAKAKGQFLSQLSSNIQILDLQSKKIYFSLFRLIAYIKKNKQQLIFTCLHPSSVIALAAKIILGKKLRVVVRVGTTVSAQEYSLFTRWFVRYFLKYFYSRADRIIAVSHSVAGDLVDYLKLDRRKIITIYNPSITQEVIRKSREEVSHPWFEAGQPPVILGVGRLIPEKGYANLIRAYAQVRKKNNSKLVLIGDGSGRLTLENLVRELGIEGDVAFLGYQNNPYAYMRRAVLFVMPSKWEGLPNVLIEAMACGCAVISTNCPGGAAEILDYGRYGSLVPVEDTDALAAAIIQKFETAEPKVDPIWLEQFRVENVVTHYMSELFDEEN